MYIKRSFMGTLEIVCMPESEVVLHGCILQWHLELYTIIWPTYRPTEKPQKKRIIV